MARYISRSFDRSRLRPWPGIHNRVTVYVTRHREPSPSATSDTAPREKTRNFDRNGRSAAGYGRPYISRRCISRAFQLSENPYKFRLVSSSPRQRAFSTDESLSFFSFFLLLLPYLPHAFSTRSSSCIPRIRSVLQFSTCCPFLGPSAVGLAYASHIADAYMRLHIN